MTVHRRLTMLACTLAASALIAGCGSDDDDDGSAAGGGSSSDAKTTFTVAAPVPDSVISFDDLVAAELGFYEDENLEIKYAPSGEEIPIGSFIANGEADIGSVGAVEALAAKGQGADVKIVYDAWTKVAEGIVTPTGSGIESIEDLKGKKVGLASSEEDRAFLSSALEQVGLSIDDVELTVVGSGGPAVANSLKSKEFDAFGGAISDFAAFRANGVEVTNITPEGLANTPAGSFLVAAGLLNDKREALVGFLRATAKATLIGQEMPEAVEAITRKRAPEDWRDEKVGKALMEASIDSVMPVQEGDPFGVVTPERWKLAQDQLLAAEALEEPANLDEMLVTDLVEEANDFDRDAVLEEARTWLEQNG